MTKTKQCRFYAVGRCEKGNRCTFSHGPKETKRTQLSASNMQRGSCASGSAYSFEHTVGESHGGVAATTKMANAGQSMTPGYTPQQSIKDLVLQQLLTTPQSATAEDVLMSLVTTIAHHSQGQRSYPPIEQSSVRRAHTIGDPRTALECQREQGLTRSAGLLEQCCIPGPPHRLQNKDVAFPSAPGCRVPPGACGSSLGQSLASQSADEFDVSNCDIEQLQLLAAVGACRLEMLGIQPPLNVQGEVMNAQHLTQWQMRSPGDFQRSGQNLRHNAEFDSRIASPPKADLGRHHQTLPNQDEFFRNTKPTPGNPGWTTFQTPSIESGNAINTFIDTQRDINQLDWNTEVARESLHRDSPQIQSSGRPREGLDSAFPEVGEGSAVENSEGVLATYERKQTFPGPSVALDDSTSSSDLASRYGIIVKNGFLALNANNHLSDEYNAFKSQTCPDLPSLTSEDEESEESSEELTSSNGCDLGTPGCDSSTREKLFDARESIDIKDYFVRQGFNSLSELKTLR